MESTPESYPPLESDKYALITWAEIESVLSIMELGPHWILEAGASPLIIGEPYDKENYISLLLTEIYIQYTGEGTQGIDTITGEAMPPIGWASLPYEVRDFYCRATYCESQANGGNFPQDWPRDKDPQ